MRSPGRVASTGPSSSTVASSSRTGWRRSRLGRPVPTAGPKRSTARPGMRRREEWLVHRRAGSSMRRQTSSAITRRSVGASAAPGASSCGPTARSSPSAVACCETERVSLAVALDHGFYYEDERLPVVVAPVRDVGEEWRFVVVDGAVVTGSGYVAEGRTSSEGAIPGRVRDFAGRDRREPRGARAGLRAGRRRGRRRAPADGAEPVQRRGSLWPGSMVRCANGDRAGGGASRQSTGIRLWGSVVSIGRTRASSLRGSE